MDYAIRKRTTCSVCGLDTFVHTGWFLVVENRWLDGLKILSWHPSLARQKAENKHHAPEFPHFDQPESRHGLSLQ